MFATNFCLLDDEITWLSGQDKLTRWGQSATIASGANFLRVGTVDDIKLHDEILKPRVEQFTTTRVAWYHGMDGVKKAEGQFPFGK
ncbi:hypothetical protein LTR17_002112 [Elasticomyces elasticus]|nr:hypothetical protein LTR17_002112 [Elasticomyces elasticus]